jgi:hypothetical protein
MTIVDQSGRFRLRAFALATSLVVGLMLTSSAQGASRYPQDPFDWDHSHFTYSLADTVKLALIRDFTGHSDYDQTPPFQRPPNTPLRPCKAEDLSPAWATQPWVCEPLGLAVSNFINDPGNWDCTERVVNGTPLHNCRRKTPADAGCENRDGCARLPIDPSLLADPHLRDVIAKALADPCRALDNPRSLDFKAARRQRLGLDYSATANWNQWRCGHDDQIKPKSVTFDTGQVIVLF